MRTWDPARRGDTRSSDHENPLGGADEGDSVIEGCVLGEGLAVAQTVGGWGGLVGWAVLRWVDVHFE